MKMTRREFLKSLAGGAAGLAMSGLRAQEEENGGEEVTRFDIVCDQVGGGTLNTICALCPVGCGLKMDLFKDRVVCAGGGFGHPVNGMNWVHGGENSPFNGYVSGCARALNLVAAEKEDVFLRSCRTRAGSDWKDVRLDRAISAAADLISGSCAGGGGGVAMVAGAGLTNEECYLARKLAAGLGIWAVDSTASEVLGPTTRAMLATFGRAGATIPLPSVKLAKRVLVVGADVPAEAPVAARWIFEAVEANDARLMVVNPRQDGLAARAHVFAQVRPGTELALVLGLINFVLSTNAFTPDYLKKNTDAALLISNSFRTVADADGVFSGLSNGRYDTSTWRYLRHPSGRVLAHDKMLHPRTLINVMRKHFAVYDATTVCRVTGIGPEQFENICRTFCAATFDPSVPGLVVFGRGLTATTQGTQAVRALCILQLLLSNVGFPGAGLLPVFPQGNGQGAADLGFLAGFMPGCLPAPTEAEPTLEAYLKRHADATHAGVGLKERIVSCLIDTFDTSDPEEAYRLWPKPPAGKTGSIEEMIEAADDGRLEGVILLGEDPAETHGARWLEAAAKLKWLVVFDPLPNRTAEFFTAKGRGSASTEVIQVPGRLFWGRAGTTTTLWRRMQWTEPEVVMGQAEVPTAGITFINRLHDELLSREGVSAGLAKLRRDEHADDPLRLAPVLGGKNLKNNKPLASSADLAADGSTRCFCWSYAGCGQRLKGNSNRDPSAAGLYRGWGHSTPDGVCVMFNRASVKVSGDPLSTGGVVRYVDGVWSGSDVVDGADDPAQGGFMTSALDVVFMKEEGERGPRKTLTMRGLARLFAPELASGPLPAYYEEPDVPLGNLFTPPVPHPPVVEVRGRVTTGDGGSTKAGTVAVIATRHPTREAHGRLGLRLASVTAVSGGPFIELDRDTAEALGIGEGSTVRVETVRGAVEGKATIVRRLPSYHWSGVRLGTVAVPVEMLEENVIFPTALDPDCGVASLVAVGNLKKV